MVNIAKGDSKCPNPVINACSLPDCQCVKNLVEQKRKEDEKINQEHEIMLHQVEDALQKASLVWSESHKPIMKKRNRVITSNATTPTGENQRGQNPNKKSSAIAESKEKLGIPNGRVTMTPAQTKQRDVKYKPVYQTAPFRTETMKLRRPLSSLIKKKTRESPINLDTESTTNQKSSAIDKKIDSSSIADTHCEKLSPNQDTLDPSMNANACTDQKYWRTLDPEFICTCEAGRTRDLCHNMEYKWRRLNSIIITHPFGASDPTGLQYEHLFHILAVNSNDQSTSKLTLLRQYRSSLACFNCFAQIINDLALGESDPIQMDSLRQITTRFIHLHAMLNDAFRQLIQCDVTEKSTTASHDPNCSNDSLGQWLFDQHKGSKVLCNANPIQGPRALFHAYMVLGPQSMPPTPTRMVQMTQFPILYALQGTKKQARRFLQLWVTAEEIEFDSALLAIQKTELHTWLNQVSERSDKASAFRELYGFICTTYPVALKDSFET